MSENIYHSYLTGMVFKKVDQYLSTMGREIVGCIMDNIRPDEKAFCRESCQYYNLCWDLMQGTMGDKVFDNIEYREEILTFHPIFKLTYQFAKIISSKIIECIEKDCRPDSNVECITSCRYYKCCFKLMNKERIFTQVMYLTNEQMSQLDGNDLGILIPMRFKYHREVNYHLDEIRSMLFREAGSLKGGMKELKEKVDRLTEFGLLAKVPHSDYELWTITAKGLMFVG